jgi:hypothetical protein
MPRVWQPQHHVLFSLRLWDLLVGSAPTLVWESVRRHFLLHHLSVLQIWDFVTFPLGSDLRMG